MALRMTHLTRCGFFLFLSLLAVQAFPASSSCPASALEADVVAIDHPMVFNRLGAQNINWMMYALRRDLIDAKTKRVLDNTAEGEQLFRKATYRHASRGIALRPDLRPRPLVLRVAERGYLKVRFTNLLHISPVHPRSGSDPFPNEANPFHYPDPLPGISHPVEHAPLNQNPALSLSQLQDIYRLDDQVASRAVGFHPQGLELVGSITDDSSFVGRNDNSLAPPVPPGETREYCFFAPKEGAYLISSDGAVFGGDGTSGNSGVGLFGAVTVQPAKARFYRAQVTEEEMRLATVDVTASGQPVINYETTYPDDCPDGIWCREGKAGLPVLNMVKDGRIVHGDINALIVGPNDDGSFDCSTYPIEKEIGECKDEKKKSGGNIARNPALPNRLEPFREFVSIFHDENSVTQAFPYFFEHPELVHTLHGVRDTFMINYGSGGIGAEIIANRLKAGPMQDCLDCAYEEFFLSSSAVGDPAMLVDKPVNLFLSQCQPEFIRMIEDPAHPGHEILDPAYDAERRQYCTQPKDPSVEPGDQRATRAFYPHDPANVHHSYIGDFVKFRNLHSGKEQHIFHLHNHQWLFNPNDDNSNYLDAQGLGPGSGYTYEIAYGGSGNRNKTVGDAIFHCHFYPHFAQGMWYLWRIHDVFEAGTRLAVTDEGKNGKGENGKGGGKKDDEGINDYHTRKFGLMDGTPAAEARALPDGEIVAGTPIPAVVPLPGKGMAPMPLKVTVKPRVGDDGKTYGSVAEVTAPPAASPSKAGKLDNPGYPFWVAGVAGIKGQPDEQKTSVGSRPPNPPLDMSEIPGIVKGEDGGLRRHALAGYSAGGETHEKLDRLTAEKEIKKAKPVYYPEEGTRLERLAMAFHASRAHDTHKVGMDGIVSPAKFVTNGAPPVPGAPYNDPCIDDRGKLLTSADGNGEFFGSMYGSYIQAKDPVFSPHGIEFGSDNPRVYKGANLQLDVVFNKLGYHYPQQRILTLWKDVGPLLDKTRAPEPLVIRMNTYDCAMYAHTNLVPKDFYADDYQITTPTDVIGQHIHLPKWDLTSADGSANGWNYEDGTFSPGMVRERITAINNWNREYPHLAEDTDDLVPAPHFYFKGDTPELADHQKDAQFCTDKWNETGGDAHKFAILWGKPGFCDWFGARTTLQRWFSDPLINRGGVHRGLGITFTHDHLGPSTHQQLGLYATMLTEPPGSLWRHNESGVTLYGRNDGGPTSWQAVITGQGGGPIDTDNDQRDDSHREFFLQFGDFQHAYQKGEYYGVDYEGVAWPLDPLEKAKPTKDSFRAAINPSVRKPANSITDIIEYAPDCPGGKPEPGEPGPLPGAVYSEPNRPPRPCPEAISADDIGMLVVNYRNEPVGARVFNPDRLGPDGRLGTQADRFAGDLTYAFQTTLPASALMPGSGMRGCRPMNSAGGNDPAPGTPSSNPLCTTTYVMDGTTIDNTPYGIQTGVLPGDPFTPVLRAYSGDLIRVKVQAGSHEHEHNASINGLGWLQGGSGFGQAPHSGWRNAQNTGLSEQFTFAAQITDYESKDERYLNDRLYTMDSSQDGMWNGVWGLLRSLNRLDSDRDTLVTLPSNPKPTVLAPGQGPAIDNGCPDGSTLRTYHVAAVLANQALDRPPNVTIPSGAGSQLDPDGGTLVYNPRQTTMRIEVWDEKKKGYEVKDFGSGPLHDPTAILFVYESDLDSATGKLIPGRPLEPLVLRAAAGECLQVYLTNLLPHTEMPDLDGYTSLSGIISRDRGGSGSGATSFNNNHVRPSHNIGLHPQLVHYDIQAGDGNNAGLNTVSTAAPGETKLYTWYAGIMEIVQSEIGMGGTGPGAKGRVCHPYAPGDESELDEKYLLLELFAQPKPRPLSILLTRELFQREISRIVRQTPSNAPDATSSDSREAEKSRFAKRYEQQGQTQGQKQTEKQTESLIAAIVETAGNFSCLDSVASHLPEKTRGKRISTRLKVGEQKKNIDTLAVVRKLVEKPGGNGSGEYEKAFPSEGKLLAAVRALDTDGYYDRGKVMQKRLVCSALMREPLKNRLREKLKAESRHLSPNLEKILAKAAPAISNVFAFPGTPRERLNEDTTRLAKLSEHATDGCRFAPVEFGATNLTPPDRIKQGQKGAVGALIIEPEGAQWSATPTDFAIDRQNPGSSQQNKRLTRTMATVTYPVGGVFFQRRFRDLVMVHQKGLNLRYADGSPVPNLAAEKEKASQLLEHTAPEDAHDSGHETTNYTAPEDAHDSGHMAINYGTEPMWFRFGLPPDAPFGKEGFGGAVSAWQAFSNRCCDNRPISAGGIPIGTVISADQNVGEPYVPIMTVRAGQEMRIRALLPTGAGRASTVELHGHHWMRDPYLAERVEIIDSGALPWGNRPEDWQTPAYCIGRNTLAMHLGGQESVTPMAHFDMVFPRAGGKHGVTGDYLWRDHAGFGITSGLWAIVRVEHSHRDWFDRMFHRTYWRDHCQLTP